MVKNLPAHTGASGNAALILEWGRYARGGNGNPLQFSCLGNPMDRGTWRATVHEAAERQISLATKPPHHHH